MRLYVANLPYTIDKVQLTELFAPFGVSDVSIIYDKVTGRPRGYAFVDVRMVPSEQIVYRGRRIWIKEATKEPKQKTQLITQAY